jgi:beta-1,2-mannobiose phosphorylase / 1,2-beta-oligomannan phosphorylase
MNNEIRMLDKIILSPSDIDLSKSPLRKGINLPTYVLGAFNPGMERLENGNIIIIARVAESLVNPIIDDNFLSIRWSDGKFILEKFPVNILDMKDPRKFIIKSNKYHVNYRLTSLSWMLPVELNPQGSEIIKIHYDKTIIPEQKYQEFGVEDARLHRIDGRYYMTACSVGAERHSTVLYDSDDGLQYNLLGMIQDHQNKDMVLFPEKIGDVYHALTRPIGDHYFSEGPESSVMAGPTINHAVSPDLLHWRPIGSPFIRPHVGMGSEKKVGGGAPPIRLDDSTYLILFHGVEPNGNEVGIYRTYWCIADSDSPEKIIRMELDVPLLEARPELLENVTAKKYLSDVVFTSGIVDDGDYYLIASGELDLCCRMTRIPKSIFTRKNNI